MSNVFYVTQPVFSSGTVTVTIMADAGADVGSVDYTISYDSTEAAYDNTTGPSGWLTVPNGKTAGSVVVSEAGTTGVAISSAQTIGTVTFTPVAGASVLSLSVTITDWATEDGIEDSNHYNLGSSIVQLDTVYALAAPILPTTTLTFGAARVSNSATLTQTLPIANGTTANPLQESLLYSIAAATPFSVASGGSGTIVAGSTATPTLSLSEATSGDFNGSTISVGLTSMGTSGLANMPLTSQTVTLDGEIFAPAVPALSTTSVNFGAVHVGGTVSSTVTITNGASGALTDVLTGGFGTIASPFTGSGNLGAGITAGSSGTLTVGWTATSAGVSAGSAGLSLDSHDTILPDLAVATGSIGLTGTGYAYAAPILPTATLNFGAARVGGGTLTQVLPIDNGTTASAYQESLLYAIVTPPPPFSVSSGGSGTIVSGASATPTLALSETTSGSFAATGTVDLTSTGAGTSGLGNTTLSAQTVTLTGEIFATATAQPSATSVNFGVVHVGQTVVPVSLGITNTATSALTDLLTAGSNSKIGSYTGTVTDSLGSGLAAGTNGTVSFAIVTSSSGTQAGTVDLGFFSHDTTLTDLALSVPITVTGTVDNYASAAVEKLSGAGALTPTGANTYSLNFGTVTLGATAPTAELAAENTATGLADLMQGSFVLAGTTLGTFSGLGAGQVGTATPVSLSTSTAGTITETVTLYASGTNTSPYLGTLTPEIVTVTGSVGPTPGRTMVWTGTSSTSFATAGNWDDTTDSLNPAATAPGASDTLQFASSGGVITGTGTAAAILFGGNGAWNLTNNANLITLGSVTVGASSFSALSIDQRATLISAGGATIAASAAASGSSVNVTGSGSDWQVGGTLLVGNAGYGLLSISQGATVSAAVLDAGVTAEGAVDLSGSGSALILTGDGTIADAGSGTMSILNGATVSGTDLTVGSQLTGAGAVTVSDSGSLLDLSGTLYVGTANGIGELTVGPSATIIATSVIQQGQVVLEGGLLDPTVIVIEPGQISGGYGAAGDSTGLIENEGTMLAKAGSKSSETVQTFFGTIVGTGVMQIDAGSTLELTGPVKSGLSDENLNNSGTLVPVTSSQSVTFEATTGVLQLDDVSQFAGTITTLGSGDAIVITGGTLSNRSVSNGNTLTVSDNGNGGTDKIIFASAITAAQFQIVNGNTIEAASGTVHPAIATIESGTIVAFGAVHQNVTESDPVSIANTATEPAAGLDASVAGVSGSATASGTINQVAAGSTDSTHITVGINTGTVGSVSGVATLAFTSDSGAGTTTALASQTIAVAGTVYAYAAPVLSATTLNFGAARVGDSAPTQALSISNDTIANVFQEGLLYSIGSLAAAFGVSSGAAGTIVSGGSITPTLTLSTATSGDFNGATGTVDLTSTGAGTSGLGNTTLAPRTVTLNGEIFATAVPDLSTTSVNFGVVHVGDSVSQAVTIANTATGALSDELVASVPAFSSPGKFTPLSEQLITVPAGTSTTLMTVDLPTSTSGVQTGTADVSFDSHDTVLSDVSLGTVPISFNGTIDNYATAALGLDGGAGAFTPGGTVDTLNLGTVAVGAAAPTADLEAINDATATGLADLLQGSFVLAGTTGFTNIGFAAFGSLAAGLADTVGTVSLSTGTAGSFSETVTLFASGTNASGYLGTLTPDILTITGSVVGPPPGTGTYVWTGATGTNAGTAANWDDVTTSQNPAATSPGTADTAEFLNNSGTITGTLAVAAAQFGSSGLWALNSGAMLSAATSVSVGNGVVALSGGASISGTGTGDVISGTSGLSASVQLSGAGTQWNDTGSLIVGDKGLGSLLIVAGATATTMVLPTAAAPPTLSINNAGRLGGSGKASANIASSGTVFAASGTYEVQGSVTGSGVLEIDAGAELKLDGAVGTGQTVAFVGSDGTVSIAQLGSFTPATITGFTAGDEVLLPDLAYVNPSYNATTGKLTLRDNEGNTIDTLTFAGAPSATTVLNALVLPTGAVIGNQAGSDGSSVTVSGAGSQWNVTGQLDVGDAAAGALTIVNGATVSASQLVAGLQSGGSGNINVEDTGSKLSVVNNVTLGANGVGVLTLGQGTTLSVVNVLDVGKFGVVSQFNATIDPNYYYVAGVSGGSGSLPVGILIGNTGTIFASNGTETVTAPTINGALVSGGTGTGVLEIDSGGDLVLNAGTIDSSQTVNFAAGGTNEVLTIGMAGTTSGTVTTPGTVPAIIGFNPAAINGFAAGDTIVVDTTAAATFGLAGSVVSVIDIGTGGTLGVLTFAAAAQASLAYDTSGALVDVPCFAAGTLIETDRGPVAVEALREGDHVVTAEDARLEPIVWIGRRTVNCRVHPKPEQVWPVRVKKGAFGVRMPVRDLYLSPDHAVFVNDVLVPVKCLINGTSITQVKRHAVTYYHVELPRHELILAEGLAVESYLDVGDRSDFENGGGVVTLFPNFTCLKWETEGCAQLVVTGPELEAARAVVDARAASVRRQARSAPEPDARPVPRAHRKQPSKAVQAA